MSITTFNWDTTTDDLALPVSLVRGSTALDLKLRQRFKFFLGEWFLNTLEGVPYYRDVLIKSPDLSVVRSIFREVLLTTQDVTTVRSLKLEIDTAARTLSCEFIVVMADGTIFDTSKLDDPFIITV